MKNQKREKRYRRHKKVRAKIFGTIDRPRLFVFRSNQHIYAQLIDDDKGRTLIAVSDLEIKKTHTRTNLVRERQKTKVGEEEDKKSQKQMTAKLLIAFEVGKLIAEKALKKKIGKVVFDRGGFAYHGRVKALAEGAREVGLKF